MTCFKSTFQRFQLVTNYKRFSRTFLGIRRCSIITTPSLGTCPKTVLVLHTVVNSILLLHWRELCGQFSLLCMTSEGKMSTFQIIRHAWHLSAFQKVLPSFLPHTPFCSFSLSAPSVLTQSNMKFMLHFIFNCTFRTNDYTFCPHHYASFSRTLLTTVFPSFLACLRTYVGQIFRNKAYTSHRLHFVVHFDACLALTISILIFVVL